MEIAEIKLLTLMSIGDRLYMSIVDRQKGGMFYISGGIYGDYIY